MENHSDIIRWKILIVDDDEDDYLLVRDMLSDTRYGKVTLEWASSYEAGRAALVCGQYDAVLMDYDLGAHNGLELIREAAANGYPGAFILFTGRGSYEVDMEAMMAGASMYLTKGETSALMLERGIRYAIERKQAERLLQERDRKLSVALEAAHLGIWTYSFADHMFEMDEQAQTMYCASRPIESHDEIVKNFLHPDDLPLMWEQLQKAADPAGDGRYQVEYRILQPDGAVRWLSVRGLVEFEGYNSECHAVRLTGASHDITPEKQAQEDLQLSQQRYAMAQKAAGVISWERDLETNEMRWSVDPISMLGYPCPTFNDLLACTHPDDRKMLQKAALNTLRTGKGEVEHRVVFPDGRVRWLHQTGGLIQERSHWPIRMLGIVEDVTGRREAEQISATILRTVQSGYWLFNLDARILEVNEAYCRMSGYRREELLHMHVWDLEADETREEVFEHIRLVKETGHHQFETRHRRKDGSIFDVEIRTTYLDIEGGWLVVLAFDISDRKQVEERLAYQARLLTQVQDAIVATDAQMKITYWNPAAEALFGWSGSEVLGKYITELSQDQAPDPSCEGAFSKLMERGYNEGEAAYCRKDGSSFTAQAKSAVLRGSQGEFIGLITSVRDITGRKQDEEELRRSKQRLVETLESINDGFLALDRDWRFTYINRRAAINVGKQPDELLGQILWEVFPQILGSAHETNYRKAMEARVPVRFEIEGVLTHPSYDIRVYPSADGISVYWIDITEQKLVEEKLKVSERKYRELVQYAPAGIYELDFQNKRFTSVNDAMCELSGYSRDELLQMDPFDILDEQSRRVFQERLAKWLSGEKPDENVEYKVRAKDGHDIYAILNVTFTTDENGKPLGATVVGHDITERKRAEALLRRSSDAIQEYSLKLEQSNKELENFALVASHDLQEPLRKIEMFGAQLAKSIGPGLSETERDYLERMEHAAARMRKMIEDLLALSMVTTKGQPFSEVDLNKTARLVLDDMEYRIRQTGGEVSIGELPTVQADPVQMQQLLLNLIGNALKFHKPGTPPRVCVSSSTTPAGQVEIKVEDNGIGFDLQAAGRMFQPFQRFHGHSEYEGTGIGLSVCRKIVERHGGSITAHSQPGEGSRFTVTLPIK